MHSRRPTLIPRSHPHAHRTPPITFLTPPHPYLCLVRILIGGPANFAIGDDPFAGMTPREVGCFLASERRRLGMTRGAEGEAFEGQSQSEIEARIEGEVDERDPRHPRVRYVLYCI